MFYPLGAYGKGASPIGLTPNHLPLRVPKHKNSVPKDTSIPYTLILSRFTTATPPTLKRSSQRYGQVADAIPGSKVAGQWPGVKVL